VTDYLKYEHGFRSVSLSTGSVAPIQDQLAERLKKAGSLHQAVEDNLTFPTVEALLDFVTTRWRDRWIINGIWSESDLEALLRRPFFLLISVDAPISVRWARYQAKYVYINPRFEAEADLTPPGSRTLRRLHCLRSKVSSNTMTTNYTIPRMA
jgi:dCMP deaminase